ncbi:cell wall-binding repeat-containing protein [Zhihengliuella halotolerans]|uniref:cell wall-binding repeat-containing protein n=1 Tax=Zhihengliuella halotolerans TaxID=370736 RepID=UPI0015E0D248|nr:cell wall-binding repeat-containing protein [Zhihengliuella halotolerans]
MPLPTRPLVAGATALALILSTTAGAAHALPDAEAESPPESASAQVPQIPEGPDNPEATLTRLTGQTSQDVVSLAAVPEEPVVISVSWSGDDPHAEYRSLSGGAWSGWEPLPDDPHVSGDGETFTAEPVAVVDAARIEIRPTADGVGSDALDVEALSSPVTDVDRAITQDGPAEMYSSTAGSVLNEVIPRESWGAAPPVCDLGNAKRKHATIIHHTAGANSYAAAQVPSLLRSIQQFHMGLDPTWCDIGYHMLVDRFGNIYEGRGGGVAPARIATHAAGWNGDTFGISLMGNYSQAAPQADALSSLSKLAGWQAAYWGYDPTDFVTLTAGGGGRFDAGEKITLPRVLGHRDVGYTECPGHNLYSRLGDIRHGAREHMRHEVAGHAIGASRVAGDTRYTTAIAASQRSHPDGAGTVYIATGGDFADALVAAPAAAHADAALLLTKPGYVPGNVLQEIKRLSPRRAVIVGGTAAVSASAADQIGKVVPSVVRRGGETRYDTARNVARGAFSSTARAYIATGENYPDALSASAVAAYHDAPVLLARGSRSAISPATDAALEDLGVSKVVLAGGTAVISPGVESSLAAYAPWRVAGADRYATSRLLNKYLLPKSTQVFFATGGDFPDALSGAALAAAEGSPLYLARPRCVPLQMRSDIFESPVRSATLVGGSAVISSAVARLEPCL